MKSGLWKGVGAGLILFLLIAVATSLTPLRLPVLKAVGRDYAALQLQKRAAETPGYSPRAGASDALTPERVEVRLDAWHKRNTRLSPFGLLGWFMDLWPWLLGLGLALPVLGGLIGLQVDAQARARNPESRGERDESPLPKATITPAVPARVSEGVPDEAAPPPEVDMPPPVAAPPPLPLPPEEWSWNAKPAARSTPARPKPPPVISPNGDSL